MGTRKHWVGFAAASLICLSPLGQAQSATPLAANLRDEVQSGLARTYGETLEMSFGENPELIGGIRIRVGSDVYDGSIRAKLTALASRL